MNNLIRFMILHNITIVDFIKLCDGTIALWLLYLRFKTTDDIQKNQEKQFHSNNQYKNFLETSKLLTNKNSTIEAKISAMYLLYDYAKNYPKEIEKVYQLIGEYIKPLLSCINNNCKNQKYSKIKNSLEIEKLSRKMIYEYKEQKVLELDVYNENNNLLEIINKWQISGNNTEKEISIALIILRDLTMNILNLPDVVEHIELSNIIIFNLNKEFTKNEIKFKSINRPTYNLIFLNCNLKGIDFSKSKFYYCKFINCDLDKSNFSNCVLNYTEFHNSDLSDANFKNVKLENVKFKQCINKPTQ